MKSKKMKALIDWVVNMLGAYLTRDASAPWGLELVEQTAKFWWS